MVGDRDIYSNGRDGLQILLQQGTKPIENYYSKLITLWKKINRRQPNPIKDPNDIIIYNRLTQQNRLYQFLAGIDESFDEDKIYLLLQDPLPTVEEAYASIR